MATTERSSYMTNFGMCTVIGVFSEVYKLVELRLMIIGDSNSWSINIVDQEPELIKQYMGVKESLQRLDGYTYAICFDNDNNLKMNVYHSDRYIDFDKTFILQQMKL